MLLCGASSAEPSITKPISLVPPSCCIVERTLTVLDKVEVARLVITSEGYNAPEDATKASAGWDAMTRKPLVVLEVFKACDIRIGPAKYPCTVEEAFRALDTRIGPAKYACNDEDAWTVLSPV